MQSLFTTDGIEERAGHMNVRWSKGLARSALVTVVLGATLGTIAYLNIVPAAAGGARCGGETATMVGGAGGNEIDGTPGRDVIQAGGGNDEVDGHGGNDLICGGKGNDSLSGDAGSDEVRAGRGNDELDGNGGVDRLFGGRGRDDIDGGAGDDSCTGGEHVERC
jgi:Ca2+-binding RTX toxin-like protein